MIQYRLATTQDNILLQDMLNENGMAGSIEMVLTRSPHFFAAQHYFGQEHTMIALDNQQAVGMYQVTKHQVYLNGEPKSVAYLGGLRVNRQYRHKLSIVKKGFQSLVHLIPDLPDICYTSIASENTPAIRLLAAKLKQMPYYHYLGEMVTMAVSCARAKPLNLWQKSNEDLSKFCQLYQNLSCRYNLSPVLTQQRAASIKASFFIMDTTSQGQACMALWNQQNFKQVKAKHYSFPLNILRPFYNVYAHFNKKVMLPKPSFIFDQSFLAFWGGTEQTDLVPLIQDALALSSTPVVTFALPACHPQLSNIVKYFQPIQYRTRIYQVILETQKHVLIEPQNGIYPEVAIL